LWFNEDGTTTVYQIEGLIVAAGATAGIALEISSAAEIVTIAGGEAATAADRLSKNTSPTTSAATERMVQVTSWAKEGITPDLTSGRWVQIGEPTKLNFLKTGLTGPKMFVEGGIRLENSNVPYSNFVTGKVPENSIQWPKGAEFWKGVLGQRQIK
jgi:hypothetical protein